MSSRENPTMPPNVPPSDNDDTIELTEADMEEEPVELSESDLESVEEDPTDVSGKIERAGAETRGEWQKMELVKGRIEEFAPDLSVQFEMRKDQDKRPGDEPGEDMFLADKETGLTGVFDGLGGEGSGDKASAKAAEMAPEHYEQIKALLLKNKALLDKTGQAMIEKQAQLMHPSQRDAAIEAGRRMWKQMPEELKVEMVALFQSVEAINNDVVETGGKTTLTLGKTITLPDGRMFEVIANVGDSGAFKVREDGSVRDLTQEDSTLDQALAMGLLTPEQAQNPDHLVKIGKNEVPVSKLRAGMYQALGADLDSPRVTVTEIRPGEKVVYVTDGIRDIRAFETKGQFDSSKTAEVFAGHDGEENLASTLSGKAAEIERAQKDEWGKEKARAELAGRAPDKRLMPKLDEKTVLVKERRAEAAGQRRKIAG